MHLTWFIWIFNQFIFHTQQLNWDLAHLTNLMALSSFSRHPIVEIQLVPRIEYDLNFRQLSEKDIGEWILMFACIFLGSKLACLTKRKQVVLYRASWSERETIHSLRQRQGKRKTLCISYSTNYKQIISRWYSIILELIS